MADVILKDKNGIDKTHPGITRVRLNKTDGGTAVYTEDGSGGTPLPDVKLIIETGDADENGEFPDARVRTENLIPEKGDDGYQTSLLYADISDEIAMKAAAMLFATGVNITKDEVKDLFRQERDMNMYNAVAKSKMLSVLLSSEADNPLMDLAELPYIDILSGMMMNIMTLSGMLSFMRNYFGADFNLMLVGKLFAIGANVDLYAVSTSNGCLPSKSNTVKWGFTTLQTKFSGADSINGRGFAMTFNDGETNLTISTDINEENSSVNPEELLQGQLHYFVGDGVSFRFPIDMSDYTDEQIESLNSVFNLYKVDAVTGGMEKQYDFHFDRESNSVQIPCNGCFIVTDTELMELPTPTVEETVENDEEVYNATLGEWDADVLGDEPEVRSLALYVDGIAIMAIPVSEDSMFLPKSLLSEVIENVGGHTAYVKEISENYAYVNSQPSESFEF